MIRTMMYRLTDNKINNFVVMEEYQGCGISIPMFYGTYNECSKWIENHKSEFHDGFDYYVIKDND